MLASVKDSGRADVVSLRDLTALARRSGRKWQTAQRHCRTNSDRIGRGAEIPLPCLQEVSVDRQRANALVRWAKMALRSVGRGDAPRSPTAIAGALLSTSVGVTRVNDHEL